MTGMRTVQFLLILLTSSASLLATKRANNSIQKLDDEITQELHTEAHACTYDVKKINPYKSNKNELSCGQLAVCVVGSCCFAAYHLISSSYADDLKKLKSE